MTYGSGRSSMVWLATRPPVLILLSGQWPKIASIALYHRHILTVLLFNFFIFSFELLQFH